MQEQENVVTEGVITNAGVIHMKITQCDRILNYMMEFGSITQLEALRDLGCFRLASRINDLKKKGYKIRREMVDVNNRYGEVVQIARYRFEGGI